MLGPVVVSANDQASVWSGVCLSVGVYLSEMHVNLFGNHVMKRSAIANNYNVMG